MMNQFLHTHPMHGVKGVRALHCIVDGKCIFMVWLPDQTV